MNPQQPETGPQTQPAAPAAAPTSSLPQYQPSAQANQLETGKDKPSNHRVLAAFSILFSPLFGCIALYCSFRVDKALDTGDMAKAARTSSLARTWAIVAYIVGTVVSLLYIVL